MKKTVFAGSTLFFSLLCFTAAAFAAPMEVFVSISPQKWVSDHVGGSLVTTHVLVGKGQDPHTYEPTPKQIAALARAKMYFTLDLEFEEQIVPRLEKTVPTLHMIDTADAIPKIAMTAHEHDEPGHGESGHDEHAHAKDQHHHEEGMDPHVWLSPLNLKIMAAEMAKAMIAQDPANKSSYEKNLKDVNQILDRVHQQITQELAPYHGASFYVFHPAFGYFAQAYHLQQQAIETGGKSPSPKQLSALINQAKENKARIIFVQPQFDPKSAQAIANGIAGEVVPLDPLAEDVVSNLEIMAGKIKSALSAQ